MNKIAFLLIPTVLAVCLLSIALPVKAVAMEQQQAMDILLKMAKTLAGAEQFSFTLHSSYDAPQLEGQMIEFGTVRSFQVKRPDKLRVDVRRSDGNKRFLVFDGKRIVIHNITENIYARAEKDGTVDDAVKYMVGALKIPLPLARLLLSSITDELKQLVEEIDYVELNVLTDVATHHLAVRSRDVDFQIWIARDKAPLPRRIVITFKNFEGEPQFRADFSNWNLTAEGVKGPFTYTPPENAEHVPLLVRRRAKAGAPVRKEGAK